MRLLKALATNGVTTRMAMWKRIVIFIDETHKKGNVEVILLDRKKQQLMRLNPQSPICKIELDARNRYYLRWEFKGATGKCELRW